MPRLLALAVGVAFSAASFGQPAAAPEPPPGPVAATPGALRQYATIHSIGIEWDIAGDSNHNATCDVQLRRKGAADWTPALPLFRTDYAWFYGKDKKTGRLNKSSKTANMLAGSLFFLHPGATYEIRLALKDPDGGQATKDLTVTTRPVPALPTGGRTFHVVPGDGGGDGSEKVPFKGIAAAEAVAKPGDIFLLRKGSYGAVELAKAAGGEGGKYIVWKAAGDGEVLLSALKLGGSYLWIEGLTLKRADRANGITTNGTPIIGTVISRNSIAGFHYNILMNRQCRDWHISDNTIVGDKVWPATKGKDDDPLSGEGIECAESIGGHVLCYNSISRVADGFSYPGHDTDAFGNDIFEVTDDATECDRGWANIRVWGNRCTNFSNSGLSFQPMNGGPWYYIRNQFIACSYQDTEVRAAEIFKFRVQDRFAFINNTFVSPKAMGPYMDSLFLSLSRNNLYISSTGVKPIWAGYRHMKDGVLTSAESVLPLQTPDWRTDVDYDGFDYGPDCKTWKDPAFRIHWCPDVQKCYFVDIKSMSEALGIEKHALRVRKEDTFEKWDVPVGIGPVTRYNLTLKKDCSAVDAGQALPNICSDFTGKAPDLGAFESGKLPMHFGPRDEKAMKDHALYWALY